MSKRFLVILENSFEISAENEYEAEKKAEDYMFENALGGGISHIEEI